MGKKKKKKSSNLKLIIVSVIGMIFLVGAIFGYHFYSYIYLRNVKMDKDSAEFYIHSDWGFEEVSGALKEQGIINNQESFEYVAGLKGYNTNVKPGKFLIQNKWSNSDLINHIRLSGNQIPVKVTFHNISHLTQLAGIIATDIEADSTEIISAILNPEWMDEHGFTKETIQAIFIPNTYEIYWSTTGAQFVNRMYKEYQHFWTVDNKKKAEELGLTPIEVSTLASIVEAETKKTDEMPKVAGLYLNRLTIGMRLQSDPTVVFAKNEPGIHRVYYADLKIESPYNTYIHTGLPPGPIGFPSTKALNAVLNHTKSNYLYMCAKPDYSGYHNFASSYKKHQQYAAKYRAFLRKEGIR
jgi:UPF0755 protein